MKISSPTENSELFSGIKKSWILDQIATKNKYFSLLLIILLDIFYHVTKPASCLHKLFEYVRQ